MNLIKTAHIAQLIGCADKGGEYALPYEITDTFKKMPKFPIADKNDIDLGSDSMFLQSPDKKFSFYLEDGIIYLNEPVYEMGGLIAYTYLTPIAQFDEEYVKDLGNTDLSAVSGRIAKKQEKRRLVMQEQERLCRTAANRARGFLRRHKNHGVGCALISDELSALLKQGKYFVRRGKPDYFQSQIQMIEFIIQKNNLAKSPDVAKLVEMLNIHGQKCENKTRKILTGEFVEKLPAAPKLNPKQKNKTGGSGKIQNNDKTQNFDFRELLAELIKPQPKTNVRKQFEKEYPAKAKEILRVYTAEEEIQTEIKMPENAEETKVKNTESEYSNIRRAAAAVLSEYKRTSPLSKKSEVRKTQIQTNESEHIKDRKSVIQPGNGQKSQNETDEKTGGKGVKSTQKTHENTPKTAGNDEKMTENSAKNDENDAKNGVFDAEIDGNEGENSSKTHENHKENSSKTHGNHEVNGSKTYGNHKENGEKQREFGLKNLLKSVQKIRNDDDKTL